MATMYELINKFLVDPRRKSDFTSLAQDDAYRDLFLSISRDDPHAVVDPSPSDVKRLASAEARAKLQGTLDVGATKSMITQMYRKNDLMTELKQKASERSGEEPTPSPRGPRQ